MFALGGAHRLRGVPQTKQVALMEDGQSATDACQRCGSSDIQHRSHLVREDAHSDTLVLRCDNCHRELLESLPPDGQATGAARPPLRIVEPE